MLMVCYFTVLLRVEVRREVSEFVKFPPQSASPGLHTCTYTIVTRNDMFYLLKKSKVALAFCIRHCVDARVVCIKYCWFLEAQGAYYCRFFHSIARVRTNTWGRNARSAPMYLFFTGFGRVWNIAQTHIHHFTA
jgi:hypothetical protein